MRLRRLSEPADTPEARLRRARERLEIIEAIEAGLARRDEVLRLVADAPDVDHARDALMRLLDIGPHPATALLDMQLRRMPVKERQKIADEAEDLRGLLREFGG